MKRGITAVLTLITLAFAAWFISQERVSSEAHAAAAVSPTVEKAVGYRVHMDPSTGRILEDVPIPMDQLSKEVTEALSSSTEGLVERAGPTGGFVVDLQGRFQNTLMATVDEDGSVTAPCVSGVSGTTTVTTKIGKE